MASPELLIDRVQTFGARVSVIDDRGASSYALLFDRAVRVAGALLAERTDLDEGRVAYLVEPGADHVATLFGIWLSGGIAVPLALSHPTRELDYVLSDSGASVAVASPLLAERLQAAPTADGMRVLLTDAAMAAAPAHRLPTIVRERRAMMVYTSGTTGRPKGVVTTHDIIAAQVSTLAGAWEWTAADRSLHTLPLHHIHGIINALASALWSGASVEFVASFDPIRVWDRLASGEISFFTAVPTIYNRLLTAADVADAPTRDRWVAGARQVRVMLSGSAALPISVLERFERLTGHRLLERYGMTEIGMALSNPLRGTRRAGTVGQPLPGVEARLIDEHGREVPIGSPGQIAVRGPQVFREYWGRPEDTRAAFVDGWFYTGDVAQIDDGYWRILGRQSVDIIKSAGYKISALEIEEVLREHPEVVDCAVVGRDDPDLGERIAAAIVQRGDLTTASLHRWLKERLAAYKVPRDLLFVAALPRNAMGKVTKSEVKALFG